jgi:hypothetical protein
MRIRSGYTIDVYRDRGTGRDRHGDRVTRLIGTIDNVVIQWGSPTPLDAGEEFAYMTMDIYCPRSAEIHLQAGDRFVFQDATYAVVGSPTWDEVNPATGYDFGYYVVQVTVIS